jgi:hypothetical protein
MSKGMLLISIFLLSAFVPAVQADGVDGIPNFEDEAEEQFQGPFEDGLSHMAKK